MSERLLEKLIAEEMSKIIDRLKNTILNDSNLLQNLSELFFIYFKQKLIDAEFYTEAYYKFLDFAAYSYSDLPLEEESYRKLLDLLAMIEIKVKSVRMKDENEIGGILKILEQKILHSEL